MTDKKCCVCELLKNNKSFEEHINNSLKTDISVKEIWEELTSKIDDKVPTKYYLELHKTNCLKNFISSVKPVNIVSHNIVEDDLKIDFDEFDSWDSIKKDDEYSRLLNRVYYKKLLSIDKLINIQKISDNSVSSLKTLKDLINDINVEHIKLDLTDKDIIEKTGIDLIKLILSKRNISSDDALTIAKLFIDKGHKLEFLKNISDISDLETLNIVDILIKEKRSSLSKENEE